MLCKNVSEVINLFLKVCANYTHIALDLAWVRTSSISMVSKPFVLEGFVVKSAQKVNLSIIVIMCVTMINLWMI